jgi:hypothetical protein
VEEYKPNSFKSKEQAEAAKEKKVEKVVEGVVISKKKNEIQKFTDVFISEDASNVKSYLLMDIIVPAMKKAISDVVSNGIDMILYGGTKKPSGASKISYKPYERMYEKPNNRGTSVARNSYNYDDIILENRGEAEEVLSRMDEIVDMYGMVSVADLYDLVGIAANYTDNKYGWTDIRGAYTARTKDGYILKLPRALPLN